MMRRFAFVLLIVSVLMVCSCVTGTDINKKNRDGSPIWTTEIPKSSRLIYGVGSAKLLVPTNSQQAADATARADLALKIRANLDGSMAVYSSEASEAVSSAYQSVIVQSVNLTMNRVEVEQRWTAKDGTVWSLVSFRIKDLPELYADSANDYLNQLEELRILTLAKLEAELKAIGESDSAEVAQKRAQAQQEADSALAGINAVIAGMDIAGHEAGLLKYLTAQGFDLAQ